jgi:hypothetical protein
MQVELQQRKLKFFKRNRKKKTWFFVGCAHAKHDRFFGDFTDQFDNDSQQALLYAACTYLLEPVQYHTRRGATSILAHVLIQSLRSVRYAHTCAYYVQLAKHHTDAIQRIVRASNSELGNMIRSNNVTSRSQLGLAMRNHADSLWRECAVLSLLQQHSSANELARCYREFVAHVHELNLQEVHTMKPLLPGDEMSELLQRKAGPWLNAALHLQYEWMLNNPNATKQQCIEWIKSAVY